MKYQFVAFQSQVRAPKHNFIDGASARDGYGIVSVAEGVVLTHSSFAGEALVVPWGNVRYATADEAEMRGKK